MTKGDTRCSANYTTMKRIMSGLKSNHLLRTQTQCKKTEYSKMQKYMSPTTRSIK